jgi:hypothetical protein
MLRRRWGKAGDVAGAPTVASESASAQSGKQGEGGHCNRKDGCKAAPEVGSSQLKKASADPCNSLKREYGRNRRRLGGPRRDDMIFRPVALKVPGTAVGCPRLSKRSKKGRWPQ